MHKEFYSGLYSQEWKYFSGWTTFLHYLFLIKQVNVHCKNEAWLQMMWAILTNKFM